MTSLWGMEFPVRNLWHDFEIPFIGNDSVKWKGQIALTVDANQQVYQSYSLVLEAPWYYCVSCDERLGVGSNFCPKCGAALDWDHTDKDPDALAVLAAQIDQKIAEAKDS